MQQVAVMVDVKRVKRDVINSRKRLRMVPDHQLIHLTRTVDIVKLTKMDMIILFQPLLVPPSLSVINAAFCKTEVRADLNLYSSEGGCRRCDTDGKAR